jgi:hypothetical protein
MYWQPQNPGALSTRTDRNYENTKSRFSRPEVRGLNIEYSELKAEVNLFDGGFR